MPYKKRAPVDESWGRRAFCKGKDPDLWDLDSETVVEGRTVYVWHKGRRHCIIDCPVREECLRKALQAGDTNGVVRGGVAFDKLQYQRKRSLCLFCEHPIAPEKVDLFGLKQKNICWICRRYTSCLAGCGRMVKRKPYIDSYYCKYCSQD